MNHLIKYALIALGVLGVLGGLGVAIIVICTWSLNHASINQSKGPTSRDEAIAYCSIPLPTSAHNIQYASYAAGLQEGYFYIRYEAPVADCYSNARAIFADHAKQFPQYVVPKFQPVSHPIKETCSVLRIDWFDTDQIGKGVVAGTGTSWEPQIWIDENRGILYYEVSD